MSAVRSSMQRYGARAAAVLVVVVLLGWGGWDAEVAPTASAASPGKQSYPEWVPLRAPAVIGCVLTNCAGPYHGYWALDLLDPDNRPGDSVYAAGAGQFHVTSRSSACGGPGTPGNYSYVDHGNGVRSYYYHLASFAAGEGQWVDQDTVLGAMGSTGYNEPCPTNHLHFEIVVNGVRQEPKPLKACHGATLVSYPNAAGRSSWNEFVPFETSIYSDGTGCASGGGPPSASPSSAPTSAPTLEAPATATAGVEVTVSGTGRPGDTVELWGVTAPSGTITRVNTPTVIVDAGGQWSKSIRPLRNVNLQARVGDLRSATRFIAVSTAVRQSVAALTGCVVQVSGAVFEPKPGAAVYVRALTSSGSTVALGTGVVQQDGRFLLRKSYGCGQTLRVYTVIEGDNVNRPGASGVIAVTTRR